MNMGEASLVERLEDRRLLAVTLAFDPITFGYKREIDAGYAVATDPAGNFYAVGSFRGTVDVNPSRHAQTWLKAGKSSDAFIVKYSPEGRLIWARKYGGEGENRATHVEVGPSGDVFVAGIFEDVAALAKNDRASAMISRGGNDVFILRFSADGELMWKGSIGGDRDDAITALAAGDDGDVYVAGTIRLRGDIDPTRRGRKTIQTLGADDTFVERIDGADGRLIWSKVYGENNTFEEAKALTVRGGKVFVAGTFFNDVRFDRQNGSFDRRSRAIDIYLGRMDARNGRWDWIGAIGGSDDDMFAGMEQGGPDGDIYVTGNFAKTADLDPTSRTRNLKTISDQDVFVARYRQNGSVVWANQIGGRDARITATALAVGSDGSVYSTGFFEEDEPIDFDPGPGVFSMRTEKDSDARAPLARTRPGDLYISKLNADGTFGYAAQIGGEESGMAPQGIAVDNAGNPIVTGAYTWRTDFDPTRNVLLRRPQRERDPDVFIVKFRG